ncbi:MAG TPA: homoserine kinase [Nitrospiria bacterium]|jgi:homoserine kinase|nr:homoserine kinase [Nitrospiria bacterium]
MKIVKAFAPASIGNIGPGFDVLGMAITGLGDIVTAEKNRIRDVVIREIKGGDRTIPLEADRNTAGIAAREVLKLVKAKQGVELTIQKNIPGTGLGSSAASAVAAALAVNVLFGNRLERDELIPPCGMAEHTISGGYFIDNVAASLFGGVIVSHAAQRQAFSIGTIPDLIVVVVTPYHSVLTKISRAVLPDKVPLNLVVSNMAFTATMVAAVAQKDARRFGLAIQDGIVEPARAHLIPGFQDVKAAALKAGALGSSISGAGASVFAVTDRSSYAKKIGLAMQKIFQQHGISSTITISRIDKQGARVLRAK